MTQAPNRYGADGSPERAQYWRDYQRDRRAGIRRRRPAAERFWTHVAFGDGCWLWTGYLHPSGYGRFYADGRSYQAHVFAYRITVGPVPEGRELHHGCRTKRFVRPSHVRPVTHQENCQLDPRGSVAICRNGHPYDQLNTGLGHGRRWCRACSRAKTAAFRARSRAAA